MIELTNVLVVGTTTTTFFVMVVTDGVKRVVVSLIMLVTKVIEVGLVITRFTINGSLEAIYEGGGEKGDEG